MSYPKLALFIDGQWIDRTDEGTVPVLNPADGEVLGHLPIAGLRELESAANAAQRSFRRWAGMSPLDRFRIITAATALMRERSREIAHVLTLEQGKPLAEAIREITLSADIIDFLAEEAKRLPMRAIPPSCLMRPSRSQPSSNKDMGLWPRCNLHKQHGLHHFRFTDRLQSPTWAAH